ncbi:hypothetical protein DER44DRAFT_855392 [Fusarium oxysporum]|nr:hypothetical protein DER44DRAFT_855392 [Fusarium oxysporum]
MKWSNITRPLLCLSLACMITSSGAEAQRSRDSVDDPFGVDPFEDDPFEKDPFEDDPFEKDPFEDDPLEKDPFDDDPLEEDPLGNGQESQVPEGSCMRSFAAPSIEDMVLNSLQICCDQEEDAHESLMRDFKSIVDSAFNLLEQYCGKSCGPRAPPCLSLPLNPHTILTVEPSLELKDFPKHILIEEPGVYDFDAWLGPMDSGFELFIYQHELPPRHTTLGNFYLVPAGTKAADLQYRSVEFAELQFHAACGDDTPCISDQSTPWTSHYFEAAQPLVLDFSVYNKDMVITVADLNTALEQHAVLIDGTEVGRTHGPLSLKNQGEDIYDTAKITNIVVGGPPDGSVKSVLGQGFWGSFRVPKGSKSVTIKITHPSSGVAGYRIDQGCETKGAGQKALHVQA